MGVLSAEVLPGLQRPDTPPLYFRTIIPGGSYPGVSDVNAIAADELARIVAAFWAAAQRAQLVGRQHGLGEVSGGGTGMGSAQQIEYVGVDIDDRICKQWIESVH